MTLQGQLLVSAPSLHDPNFRKTVVLVAHHDEDGAMGLVLSRPSDVAAVEALAVVAEAAVAFELARAAREKFGGDALPDFVAAYDAYVERIPWRPTH